jgi:phosphate acetyltransferase
VTRSIYVAAPEVQTGWSVIAVGIINALTREVSNVGVFRPLVHSEDAHDGFLDALLAQPGVTSTYEDAVGATYDEAMHDRDGTMATIVARYGQMKDSYDAVVIVGTNYNEATSASELALNAQIAANLNAPVCLAVSTKDRTPDAVGHVARNAFEEFHRHHAQVIAVMGTRVTVENRAAMLEALGQLGVLTAALEEDPIVRSPSLAEQFEAVEAAVMTGSPEQLARESQGGLVAAMTLPHVLDRLFEEATVIVASDRTELIPGLVMAHRSGAFPQLAGIILTGGYELPASIQRLLDTVNHRLPIARTDLGTYSTATRIGNLQGKHTSTPRKVEIMRRIFDEQVDARALLDAMSVEGTGVRTPLMFEYQLNEMARRQKRRIVLPESGDDRILESASIVLRRGSADIVLLGDPNTVKLQASGLGLSLEGAEIISMDDPELVKRFATKYAELRAAKGVTYEQAVAKMKDPSYFGTMMVYLGLADGMVSGAINTTANTIRPSLEFVKTKPGVKVVSSSFLMCMPDRVDVYGDCAVNPDPTADQLADIAIGCAETARIFGIEPRVAMLSYSTGTSGSGADVDKVREATELVRQRDPELKVDGPIQFDAAIDPTVGKKKMPGSAVAGQATVFVFPDLNTGNNTYKAVQRSSGAVAVGPVLQGLNKPVNDLSRGALVDDIVNTIAITAIQAQHS